MASVVEEEAARAYEADPAREIAFRLVERTALDLLDPAERKAARKRVLSASFRAALAVLGEHVDCWMPSPEDFVRWSKERSNHNPARATLKAKAIRKCTKTRIRYKEVNDGTCVDCGGPCYGRAERCSRCARRYWWATR